MSKGSKQRPSQVPDRQLEDNWSNIFGSLLNHPLKYSVDVQLGGTDKDLCPVCLAEMTDELAEIHRAGKPCHMIKVMEDKQSERINQNKSKTK